VFLQAPDTLITYAATLNPHDWDPTQMRILSNLVLLGDEAECRDLNLLKMIEYISNSGGGSEEQVPTTPSLDSETVHPNTYQSLYQVPKGPTPKLAVIVRLRMLQDNLLHIRLEQAKLTMAALELQAVGSKSRLGSAVKLLQESLADQPSALPTSPSSMLLLSRPPAVHIPDQASSTSNLSSSSNHHAKTPWGTEYH